MIFTNSRCILPDGIRDGIDVAVEDGKIVSFHERTVRREKNVVDLGGNYLAPGFVDLHVHGAVGRDSMEASTEAFRAICDFHASGGTTSLLLTTITSPISMIVDVLRAVRDYRKTIPQIAGVHIEGPFISKAKSGAQPEQFIRKPTPQLVDSLLEFADVIKRVTLAPELPGALDFIDKLRDKDISISGGHSDAWDEEAHAAFEHGMRSVTHMFNCMSSARRRGMYRIGGLLEFALSEPEINCELIADGHHVSPTLMKMLSRAKSASGICLVADAIAGAGLPDGSRFSVYGDERVVKDGVCLLADRSALAGSASRMIDLVRTLVHDVGVSLCEAIMMATKNPAQTIGLKSKGRLEIGTDADLVVLSPDWDVLRTFVAGQEIFAR